MSVLLLFSVICISVTNLDYWYHVGSMALLNYGDILTGLVTVNNYNSSKDNNNY